MELLVSGFTVTLGRHKLLAIFVVNSEQVHFTTG